MAGGVHAYHRQRAFKKFPWQAGEMEAAIAAYTGKVIRLPSGWAMGLAPTYMHPKAKVK